MKLYVLDLGKIVMLENNPVTKDGDSAEGAPSIPIHAFYIETEGLKIVFDTGCIPEAMEGAWPEVLLGNPYVCEEGSDLVSRLNAIGVNPDDVDYVVLSHLHSDHAGGVHLFKNAKVLVHQLEYETVMKDNEEGTLGMFHLPCDIQKWKECDAKWLMVEKNVKEFKLCDGIKVLNLGPGHSYGMLALYLELESGNYMLVSDAVYSSIHYGPPAQLAGVVQDEKGYFEAIEAIREYSKEHDAIVLYGHDLTQFNSLTKSDEGFYK